MPNGTFKVAFSFVAGTDKKKHLSYQIVKLVFQHKAFNSRFEKDSLWQ